MRQCKSHEAHTERVKLDCFSANLDNYRFTGLPQAVRVKYLTKTSDKKKNQAKKDSMMQYLPKFAVIQISK